MEPKKDIPPPPIIDQLKEYAETRIKLAKYQAIESGSTIAASVVAGLVSIICMVFAFVFASFTLAFFLADVFKSFWAGFGCVALIYLLIAIVVKYNKTAMEALVANKIIQNIFKS